MPQQVKRVLVVDDDDTIRGLLSEALADEGYETVEATNGSEALAVMGGWRPDVILLDLMMPVMDGWAFRGRQCELPHAADVPVVLISAARDLSRQVDTLKPAAVFAKPFDLDLLLLAVGQILSPNFEGDTSTA
jgi:CheY-like chemotaxis protein